MFVFGNNPNRTAATNLQNLVYLAATDWTSMSKIMPDPTWFGEPAASRDVALAEFERAAAPIALARAAIELCKVGDFSQRSALVDFVRNAEDDAERIDAQIALLSVATEDMLLDTKTTSYLSAASPDVLFQFAGSGRSMVAKAAVPLLLVVLTELGEIDEIRDQAFDSLDYLLDLRGLGMSEADFSIDAVQERARSVVDQVPSPYILQGSAFSPASVAKRMTALVMRASHMEETFSNYAPAMYLSIWSGLRCPTYSPGTVSDVEVQELVRYASTLGSLPWRPGVKYFYGHDVEGGPGLHDRQGDR